MKVSIITITDSINYGAIWQSFALYKYISNLGVDVRMINYNPKYKKKSALFFLKEKIQLNLLRKRISRSNTFKRNNVIFTNTVYKDINDLKADPPDSNIFIVGSDQVWNSDISNGLDPSFFLEFVVKGKKVSYASSIGKSNVSNEDLNDIKKYLTHFDAISVRESSAKKLLDGLGLTHVEQVLDPVFLFGKSDYDNYLVPFQRQKYLLIYGFDSNQKIDDVAKLIAKEKGLSIIEIGGARKRHDSDNFLRNLSPEEFLGVIDGAEYIVTSSFHGTAFSIIFKKNFVSVLPAKRGTRVESILNLLGLEDRLLKDSDVINIDKLIVEPNYQTVSTLLDTEINKSKEFLFKVLKEN